MKTAYEFGNEYAQRKAQEDDRLRKAAKELLKQLDWVCDIKFSGHENSKAYYKAARELRAELEKLKE